MEQLELERVLDWLNGYNSIERMLLATSGTLQTALTALYRVPVNVEVISQSKISSLTIKREVNLKAGELVVCHAISQVSGTDNGIMRDVEEGKIGLGQILLKHGLNPQFRMLKVGQDDTTFWREYKLTAPGIVYRITEIFPKELYANLCAS